MDVVFPHCSLVAFSDSSDVRCGFLFPRLLGFLPLGLFCPLCPLTSVDIDMFSVRPVDVSPPMLCSPGPLLSLRVRIMF